LSVLVLSLLAKLSIAADGENGATSGENTSNSKTSLISPRLAAEIRAKLPDYEPPPPTTVEPTTEEDDMGDVVWMAPVTVTEKRQARGAEWQLLTPAGRAALLKERYPGAVIPGAPLTDAVHNYAKLMNTEDTRLANLEELNDMLEAARIGGRSESLKELKKDILRARMRPNDWRADSMDRSYNNGRR
jgi:hypothetical protein